MNWSKRLLAALFVLIMIVSTAAGASAYYYDENGNRVLEPGEAAQMGGGLRTDGFLMYPQPTPYVYKEGDSQYGNLLEELKKQLKDSENEDGEGGKDDIELPKSVNGDITIGVMGEVTDTKEDMVIMRVPLLYKGSTNVKYSLSLFQMQPEYSEDYPFDVSTNAVKTLDDIQTGVMEVPAEPNDYVEFIFNTKEDVVNGVYPVKFNIKHLDVFQDRFYDTPASSTVTVYVNITNGKKAASTDGDGNELKAKPVVIIESTSTNPEKVMAGQEYDLTITLKNTNASRIVSNVVCNISCEKNYALPVSGSSSFYIDGIKPGETHTETITIKPDASSGVDALNFTLDLDYEDSDHNPIDLSYGFTTPLFQPMKLEADTPRYDDWIPYGDSGSIYMNIYNKGKATVYNVMVRLDSPYLQFEENYYAGNMESGSTKTLDTYIIQRTGGGENYGYSASSSFSNVVVSSNGAIATMESAPIAIDDVAMGELEEYEGEVADTIPQGPIDANILITYEDKSGEEYSLEVPITVTLEPEPVYEDVYMDIPMEEPVEMEQGMPVWGWIAIGAGALLAVCAVIVVIVRKKKKGDDADEVV